MKNKEIEDFFDRQLSVWTLARNNFNSLKTVKRKNFNIGGLSGYVQFNPSRLASNTANVDADSIRERKCFLCENNRPEEQISSEIIPGWQALVNPFPILPYHLTIAGISHRPQKFQMEDAFEIVGRLPGMTLFFNADGAGASAPDHWHFQAVRTEDLPLISLLENDFHRHLKAYEKTGKTDLDLPFFIHIGIIDEKSDKTLWYSSINSKLSEILKDKPFNAFLWTGDDGSVRYGIVPRKAHRPQCFFKEGKERRSVSPGAIDMAGVIVTPYEEDFNAISDEEICDIYKEVAFQDF